MLWAQAQPSHVLGGALTAAAVLLAGCGGKAARRAAILRNAGCRSLFTAPSAGRLTTGWYWLPRGAHPSAAKPAPLLVAVARVASSKAQSTRIEITLTKKGRRLLG